MSCLAKNIWNVLQNIYTGLPKPTLAKPTVPCFSIKKPVISGITALISLLPHLALLPSTFTLQLTPFGFGHLSSFEQWKVNIMYTKDKQVCANHVLSGKCLVSWSFDLPREKNMLGRLLVQDQ